MKHGLTVSSKNPVRNWWYRCKFVHFQKNLQIHVTLILPQGRFLTWLCRKSCIAEWVRTIASGSLLHPVQKNQDQPQKKQSVHSFQTGAGSLISFRDICLASRFFFLCSGLDSMIISSSSKVGSQFKWSFCRRELENRSIHWRSKITAYGRNEFWPHLTAIDSFHVHVGQIILPTQAFNVWRPLIGTQRQQLWRKHRLASLTCSRSFKEFFNGIVKT